MIFIKKCKYNRLYDETMRQGWGIFYKENGRLSVYITDSIYNHIREIFISLRQDGETGRSHGRPLSPIRGCPGLYSYRAGQCRIECHSLLTET